MLRAVHVAPAGRAPRQLPVACRPAAAAVGPLEAPLDERALVHLAGTPRGVVRFVECLVHVIQCGGGGGERRGVRQQPADDDAGTGCAGYRTGHWAKAQRGDFGVPPENGRPQGTDSVSDRRPDNGALGSTMTSSVPCMIPWQMSWWSKTRDGMADPSQPRRLDCLATSTTRSDTRPSQMLTCRAAVRKLRRLSAARRALR